VEKAHLPYKWGGKTKAGADCSGAASGVFNDAGIFPGYLQSQQFAQYPFSPATFPLQPGDVGVYPPQGNQPGHVDIYGGTNTGVTGDDAWSAFGAQSSHAYFGPANSSWFGTPTWYRYNP
jgi:cell wall-associated NlpC family hydrolase